MLETTWTPASIAIGERADKLLALVIADPGELVSIPLARTDAHRIGSELVKAAGLTAGEIMELYDPTELLQ